MSEHNYSWELNAIEKRIGRVETAIDNVGYQVNQIGNEVHVMGSKVDKVSEDLAKLAHDFQVMMNEQNMKLAEQQATTEVVRIRQELEQNFGDYGKVRKTMLGVLQATDVALVKKDTISQVSEELMISTPEYWLAPCLVAVSAWISNDRDLADRAIREAMKRNEERTALTMALICRRNNRTETCYEWLSIYFAKQKATQISESSYAYIDAYINGIFGPDEKHMCDDYISRWLDEIRGSSSNFENEQEGMWSEYCTRFKGAVDNRYPALKNCVAEYDRIDAYLGRVHSVDTIKENFEQIQNAYVNQDVLKEKIDKNLIELISRYDDKEEPLRKEEEMQQAIKDLKGDVAKARQVVQFRNETRKEQRMNLVEQMANSIISDGDVLPSQKKTAISFLGSYIKKGFDRYLEEERPNFPETITINVNGWSGQTTDGSNVNDLCTSYKIYMERTYENEVNQIKNEKPTKLMAGGIGCAIGALLFLFSFLPIGLAFGAGAAYFFISMKKFEKSKEDRINELTNSHASSIQQGQDEIVACVEQWKVAKNVVAEFSAMPVPELIA